MMSEEEKKAIEYLENQDNSLKWDYGTLQAIKTALNLIEKQQKEIKKEHQNWKELLHEYGLRCEELKNSISKEKIRDKIKELQKDEDFYREQTRMYEYEGKMNMLEELLGE